MVNNRLLRCLVLLALASPTLAPFCAASERMNLFSITADSVLMHSLYLRGRRLVSNVSPSGAVGVNAAAEANPGSEWFVEQQRYGGDLVQAGVHLQSQDLVDYGWLLIDWGFNREAADGSFPGTGDAFHSASMFVEAAARALLLQKESNIARYQAVIASHANKLHAAALWMTLPEVKRVGKKHDSPYTHRRWMLAAALGETAELVGDHRLAVEAEEYAREGISLQQQDGINPEKGGFDASYQSVGLTYAERYAVVCHDESLRRQILDMIVKGLRFEQSLIENDGSLSLSGSTRTPTETARSGKKKTVDYGMTVQAFSLGYQLTKEPSFEGTAELVAKGRHWL